MDVVIFMTIIPCILMGIICIVGSMKKTGDKKKVEVLEDNAFPRKVTCPTCSSILVVNSEAYIWRSGERYYTCPCCGKENKL